MNSTEKRIAFKVEFSRMLEILADQIYQSPLALLRENTQNAFDAIRMRESLGHQFEPVIDVVVDAEWITVSDNGIGMTDQEIETNFWYAGKSGKNTDTARAAGVVGTFGIGAMANFGVASELSVESESAITGERILSSVRKSEISTDQKSISVQTVSKTGEPGTTVKARLASVGGVPVQEAHRYLHEFVEFVDIPVMFNGAKISGASHRTALPSERHAWNEKCQGISLAGIVSGDMELSGMASGELRVVIENVQSEHAYGRPGFIVLLQNRNAIRALRSGFGLSTVAAQSRYQWGGIVDLSVLKPTAGREALDDSSNSLLQRIITALDELISPMAAEHSESFANEGFLQWIVETQQFNLCGPLKVESRPSHKSETLESFAQRSGARYYSDHDATIIRTYASEDEPLVVLSGRSPRRNCEAGYLAAKGVEAVDTTPRLKEEFPLSRQSTAHIGLAIRMQRILEEDYFLGAEIRFGSNTGRLAIHVVVDVDASVAIYLDPESTSIAPLLELYTSDYSSFTPFVKDFVRSAIFPRISELVPSSTREGAEAFLRHLRANREPFEYELDDKADLREIFEELQAGRLTADEAARRLADRGRSYINVSDTSTEQLSTVVTDVFEGGSDESHLDIYEARPGIDRRAVETNARILTSAQPVNGYTCFLSLSDKVQREKGEFFLQPHTTEIVWGGQKVIFVFLHHSGNFGLYYDILCPRLVGAESGGGVRATSTILAKNRTFIPVPHEIVDDFLPKAGEKKRLEVRCDILYV